MISTMDTGVAIEYIPIILPALTGKDPISMAQYRKKIALLAQGETVELDVPKTKHAEFLAAFPVLRKTAHELALRTEKGESLVLFSNSNGTRFRPAYVKTELLSLLPDLYEKPPLLHEIANPRPLLEVDLDRVYRSIDIALTDDPGKAALFTEALSEHLSPSYAIHFKGHIPILYLAIALHVASAMSKKVTYDGAEGRHLIYSAHEIL